MAGRRGARSGRGWDALPPRPPRQPPDEHPPGGAVDGEAERGNVPARRRPPPPGGYPATLAGAEGYPATLAEAEGRAADRRHRRQAGGAGSGEPPRRDGAPEQSESERAREICLRQLAVRPRTRVELAKALARKEISDEVISEVLDRYDEVGIIDDAAFARAWVSSRHHGRGLARRALATELRRRGV